MRIAIPIRGEVIAPGLRAAEALHFYEDDHGRIVRQYTVPIESGGADAALSLLERYSVDALVCGTLSLDELQEVREAGLLFFPGYEGGADRAALDYLSGTIVFDPNNTCNACGHGHSCSMDCAACTLKQK